MVRYLWLVTTNMLPLKIATIRKPKVTSYLCIYSNNNSSSKLSILIIPTLVVKFFACFLHFVVGINLLN